MSIASRRAAAAAGECGQWHVVSVCRKLNTDLSSGSRVATVRVQLALVCRSTEFADIQLRTNEKRTLNTLNRDKARLTIRCVGLVYE